MSTTELDLEYVRTIGAEIRARLFPEPKRVRNLITGQDEDGPKPYPLPVALRYKISDEIEVEVLFIVERTIQRVDFRALGLDEPSSEPDVFTEPTWVRVFFSDVMVMVDLEFGKEPNVNGIIGDSAAALLRAVAGAL